MPRDFEGLEQLRTLENQLPAWADHKALLVASLLEGKCVLDAGCGVGTFTKRLHEKGFSMVGIDPDPNGIRDARRLAPGVDFLVGDAARLPARYKGSFDSATLLDVLEHVPKPVALLRGVRGALKAGGVLVVTVPAFQSLYAKHDATIGHYKRYSKRALRSELESAGFSVERLFHWNFPGFFGWLLVAKLLGKDPTSAANPLVNSFYDGWLSLEDAVRLPLGNTLFAKARKVD